MTSSSLYRVGSICHQRGYEFDFIKQYEDTKKENVNGNRITVEQLRKLNIKF